MSIPSLAPSSRRAGALLVVAAALLWSSGGVFIKLAPMPASAVAFGRSLVASIFYLAVLRPRLSRASWSTAAAYAATVLSFVLATRMTTAANAIFLQYTGPAWVLLLAPWLLREKLTRVDAISVVLSLAGMSLFFVGRVEAGQAAGNVIAVFSGVAFGLTVLFMRRDAAHGHGDAMPGTVLGNLLACAVALPFAARSLHQVASPAGLGVLLYLGLVQLGLSYLLFTSGLKTVPAAEASLLSMLDPVLNPIWVFLGTGERPGPWALLGGSLVIGTVAVRALWREPKPGDPSPDAGRP